MPKCAPSSVVEALESRQFRSVSYYSDGSQTADGTYYGAILFGDNGNEYGMPTSLTSANGELAGYSFSNWDTDIDDGLDSGLEHTIFALNTSSAHKAVFVVDTQLPGDFDVAASTTVHSVQIRAAVAGPGMEFEFKGIVVDFYQGGAIAETVHVNDLDANTLGSSSWDPAESVAVITPSHGNITGVQVQASFRLKTDPGVYAGQTDVGGQIFVS